MDDYRELQMVSGGFDQLPYGVSWRYLDAAEAGVYTGRPDEEAGTDLIEVQEGNLVLVPVIWAAQLAGGSRIGARHLIHVREGANLTMICLALPAAAQQPADAVQPSEAAATEPGGELQLHIRAILEKDAHLHIVNVQLLGAGQAYTLEVDADADEHAGLQETMIQLGGSDVSIHSSARLHGTGASLDCHTGMMAVAGRKKIEVGSVMTGAETVSSAAYDGAAAGDAVIELRTDGALQGREEILVLSPDAQVLSGPQCAYGEPAAEASYIRKSGTPDAQKVFYLGTRGMEEGEAAKQLALAGLMHAAGRIPDERVIQLVSQYAKGALGIV